MKNTFWGGCFDTGAQKCVIGQSQAKLFCRESGTPYKLSACTQIYSFGSGTKKSLGLVKVRIPSGYGKCMYREVDVVRGNIPFLIGLDFLDDFGMFALLGSVLHL